MDRSQTLLQPRQELLMPKTETSRADQKVKQLRKRISNLAPVHKRKLLKENTVSNVIEGLRATGTAAKSAWNSKKVSALEAKIVKLEAAKEEARQLKETKAFNKGKPFAEYHGKSAKLLKKANAKK